jgi:uracil-DNA glycosylase
MMLSEAPGYNEMRYNQPWTGDAERLLSHLLDAAELPPIKDWFSCNAVCCKPAIGAPSKTEIKSCAPNLRSQLKLCNPEWVLVLGASALLATQALAGTTKLKDVRGRPFEVRAGPFIGKQVMVTYHPGSVFKNPHYSNILADDLVTFRKVMAGELDGVRAEIQRGGKLRKGAGYL